MTAREQILGEVKRALRGEGKPEPARGETVPIASSHLEDVVSRIRENCDRRREELIEQFEAESRRIGIHFHRAADSDSVFQYIEQLSSAREAKRIIAWETEVITDLGLQGRFEERGVEFLNETAPEFIRKAEAADIGVSGVDYGVADTGTLVLLARKGQARSISLLPPVHVALIKPEQIVSGLSDLFPLLRAEAHAEGRDLSSAITLITGPSRTADIELTLVVGVHGPQQLHVLLLE
ncbi:MAG TPA: lactate utilization protein [Blastocatellia bacterium]|nr:lactate utilization protein [Blastocatellia bacterium]